MRISTLANLCRAAVILVYGIVLPARAVSITPEHVDTPDGPRSYFLVESDVPGTGLRPLVIVLHGHGGTAGSALGVIGHATPLAAWVPIAQREDVLVAALQGSRDGDGRPGWNDCRGDAVGNPRTRDVAFVAAVIAHLEKVKNADPARVYVMGMSNGAMMAYRLALELEPPPAAIAAVAGSMASHSTCRAAAHPVSVLAINGTADPLVPFDGGEVHFYNRLRGGALPVVSAVSYWRDVDGLKDGGRSEMLAHRDSRHDPTGAVRELYGESPESAQVELITVTEGGHAEPTIAYEYGMIYRAIAGRQNRDFESAEEAWRFFRDKRVNTGPAAHARGAQR